MVIGKDGRPFDKDRYVSWAIGGTSSMALRPIGEQPRRKQHGARWHCPLCGKLCKGGRAIAYHRRVCR